MNEIASKKPIILEKKEENKTYIYEIIFDKKEVADLMFEIAEKCRFKIKKNIVLNDFAIGKDSEKYVISDLKRKKDITGKSIYEHIYDVNIFANIDGNYWTHGDPYNVSFTAVVNYLPSLVQILKNLINGINSYEELLNYQNSSELIDIECQLANMDEEINNISNYDPEEKINCLKRMKEMLDFAKLNKDFDTKLLYELYLKAKSLFKLELVEERKIYKKEIK